MNKESGEIIRYGILVNEDTEESIVEVYFRQVNLFPVPNTNFKFDRVKSVLISRKDNLLELEKKFQRALNNRLFELRDRSYMVTNMRMWKSNTNNLEEIEGLSKKHKNYTQVKVEAVCLNP